MKPLLLLAIAIALTTGCNQRPAQDAAFKENNPTGTTAQSEGTTIDSLKWSYYVYNYRTTARFSKNGSWRKEYFKVIECDIEFDSKAEREPGNTDYYFRLLQPGYTHNMDLTDGEAQFFGIWDGSIVPLLAYGDPDYIHNPDSVRYHFKRKNEAFTNYLQTYNGKLGHWLHQRAIEKKIIAK